MENSMPVVAILLSLSLSNSAPARDLSVQPKDDALRPQAELLVSSLLKLGVQGVSIAKGEGDKATVDMALDAGLPAEGYRVQIRNGRVEVTAADTAGAAYAVADLLRRARIADGQATWLDGAWSEVPDFNYRSFMVDMGRNPHSPETLRRVVDMMWFYRGNYLQLHLTDDQMISWPSQVYPELYSQQAGWTLDDFRNLEEYSQARGITIVPELDVPGHSTLLRRRRPDVFGETTLTLATSPAAQRGVEKLLEEMLGVFKSSPFMHIGSDEVAGVPQAAQRGFINRINTFVKSLGRTTVVWEGPGLGVGDNKVAGDVIHMAWEGKYLAMTAMVEAGYKVVNASWDPFYIVDHYPRNNFTCVPVDLCFHADFRRMKNVDPGMRSFGQPQWLDNTDAVMGFCMPWWEGREENLLPLCLKRFAAAATRAWDYDSTLSFEDYAARESKLLPRLETISGFQLPPLPTAEPEAAAGNLAYRAKVTPSAGAHQPHFSPQRLTNGIVDQFDLFLGYPAKPKPLEIDIELDQATEVARIRVHEIAVGGSWENYRVYVSPNGIDFERVGATQQGDRGEGRSVEHTFEKRVVSVIRIVTNGCENFTFPSFSRLTEVEAFAE